MAKGGDEDNPARWGAEGLRINVVLHRLFPIAWATYCHAKAATEADSNLFVSVGSDEYRRLLAYVHAENELEVMLRSLLEGRGSERWELWGRLNNPIEDARHIPASALGALTLDFKASTADGQGVPLFDLRLRRRTLPTIQEDARETAEPAAVDPVRTGAPGRPTGAAILRAEAERRINAGEVVAQRGGLTKFSEDLHNWYDTERRLHNKLWPSITSKSICRILSPLWKSKLG
jgi:hypothetical protein